MILLKNGNHNGTSNTKEETEEEDKEEAQEKILVLMDAEEENKLLRKENKHLKERLDGTERTLEEVRRYLREMVIAVKK